jgi:tRNA-splicing ligase RtcB
MSEKIHKEFNFESGTPVKAWVDGVPLEDEALTQLRNLTRLPFIYKWVVAMPDVNVGIGSTSAA